jgi:hypothetical protein
MLIILILLIISIFLGFLVTLAITTLVKELLTVLLVVIIQGLTVGAKIYFKSGTILADYADYDRIDFSKEDRIIDLIIVQRRYKPAYQNIHIIKSKNNGTLPKLIMWHGWDAHFVSGGGLCDGRYNETELEKRMTTEGIVDCLNTVAPMIQLQRKNELFNVWPLDGFLQLEGVHSLGNAGGAVKVGNSVGKFGDCQHFCAPGPPDMIAIAMLQLIIAIFST